MVFQIVLTSVVGLLVARAAFRKGRLRENMAIIRQYRIRHIAASLVLCAVISATAFTLIKSAHVFELNPVLWVFSKLSGHGSGNGQANLVLSGLQWKWYAVVFLPVLALAVPRLAEQEEVQYRAGTRNWADGAWRSLRFGLAHMIMLIPFGASLALSIGGLWFTWMYFRGGTGRSTLYHAAFNTTVITVVFVTILVTWRGVS